MKVVYDNDKTITITLDLPIEQEVMRFVYETYGPNNLKKALVQYMDSKERGMEYINVRKEMEQRGGSFGGRIADHNRQEGRSNPQVGIPYSPAGGRTQSIAGNE
jgi:hypothetical protein